MWTRSPARSARLARLIVRGYSSSAARLAVIPFNLTDIGEGIQEVEIIEWFIEEGAAIKKSDCVCDMEDVMAEVGKSTAILIYQQDFDRENDAKGVKRSVERAKKLGANVTIATAPTVNMLNDAAHDTVISWLTAEAGIAPPSYTRRAEVVEGYENMYE